MEAGEAGICDPPARETPRVDGEDRERVPPAPRTESFRVVPGAAAVRREEARVAADLYWRSAGRSLLGLVRRRGDALGPLSLHVVGSRGPTILAFGAARVRSRPGCLVVAFPVLGGLAAARRGGVLILRAEGQGNALRLAVVVEGYTPRLLHPTRLERLAAVPYHWLQGRLHDRVTRRYLDELAERV